MLRAVTAAMVGMLLAAAPAQAFDTGPHTDETVDAMRAEGFSSGAADLAGVGNWFVDLYSNADKNPASGHTDWFKELLAGFIDPAEWPDNVVRAASDSHFDSVFFTLQYAPGIEQEWRRLATTTGQAAIRARVQNRPSDLLMIIGISLHQLQDFYSHSNWIEPGVASAGPRVGGADGPDWAAIKTYGETPTWFDVPQNVRVGLPVYVGGTPGHSRGHGGWNSDGNTSLFSAVAKDWPGRPGYDRAHMAAYFASRQWIAGIRAWVNDDAFWRRAMAWTPPPSSDLGRDVRAAQRIGLAAGHWQGQGEPCDPSWSWAVCGSREGPGGNLLDLREAIRRYFMSGKSVYRTSFEDLILRVANREAVLGGGPFPVLPSTAVQRQTRFIKLAVTELVASGLGDIGSGADMFATAAIAGQSFLSGEINNKDTFYFPQPNAPFVFVKAVPRAATYVAPITRMEVEIATADVNWAGTNDTVSIDLGNGNVLPLDKRLYDDFERGDRDTYSVPIDELVRRGFSMRDVTQLVIRKSSDGIGGGWKLRGVKLSVNGQVVYRNDSINRWLEGSSRTWKAPSFTRLVLSGPAVPVSLDLYDSDYLSDGVDDHGDINEYDMRRTAAIPYSPGATVTGFASYGSIFGGRQGDGEEALIEYRLSTLEPNPPAEGIKPPPVLQLPDLVITGMGSNSSGYYVDVKNQGAGKSGEFTVSVPPLGSATYSSLAPGVTVRKTFYTGCANGQFTALLDVFKQVAEAGEGNNTFQYSTTCINDA